MLPQKGRGRQRLLCRDVAAAHHHDVGLAAVIIAGPAPDAQALGAVADGGVHVQILQMHLFVTDDDVDIVVAAQAVVGRRQEGVDVRGQVDAGDSRFFIHHHVEEPRILMGKAVVVLAPNRGGDEQIDR